MKLRLIATITMMLAAAVPAHAALHTVICEGLGGEPTYTEQFAQQVATLKHAAGALGDAGRLHALTGTGCTRASMQSLMMQLASTLTADDRLSLYLVGHGSFDGEDYRFNVAGPDFTGRELAAWLAPLAARNQLIVALGSSSGALQDLLANASRVVITATRGGTERNYTRFGAHFVAALGDAAADTDKNGSLSAREAFDYAQRRVKDYYEREVRVVSEHAVLRGERAGQWVVARFAGAAGDGAGVTAPESPARSALVDAIEALRLRKSELPQDKYNEALEDLLLKLATLDASAPAANATETSTPAPSGAKTP
jgi:hypothetical protein